MNALGRCALVVVLAVANMSFAAPPRSKSSARIPPGSPAAAPARSVDLFAAEAEGLIEVRVIPRDEKQARVFVTNKSKEPLKVRMPDALAAVPVLAQNNGVGLFPGNGQQQGGQQAPQPVGMTPGMQQNRGNGPIFNVPPEQTRDMKVMGVCLAYGKPGPRPVMNYKLVPLTHVTTNPAVASVLRRYGRGEYSQTAAQAAAWNLIDGRTWQQLAREKGKMVSASTFDP